MEFREYQGDASPFRGRPHVLATRSLEDCRGHVQICDCKAARRLQTFALHTDPLGGAVEHATAIINLEGPFLACSTQSTFQEFVRVTFRERLAGQGSVHTLVLKSMSSISFTSNVLFFEQVFIRSTALRFSPAHLVGVRMEGMAEPKEQRLLRATRQ